MCDYRLDNNNVLWSGNKKILEDVKDVDGRYALKYDNTLVDVYHENGDSISNVKDWKESSNYYDVVFRDMTLILKNDGTLWKKLTISADDSITYFQIDKDVAELHEVGYLKNDGEYVDYFNGKIIASNVSEVDDIVGCFYYEDGSCSLELRDCFDNVHVNFGSNKIKFKSKIFNNDYTSNIWIILDNNELYCKDLYSNTVTKIADNIDKFVVNGVMTTDGECLKIENGKLQKTDKIIIKKSSCYSIVANQKAEFGMLQKNGVDILNNVKDVWYTCEDNYALRTDGTIWKVTNIPTMYMDLNANDIKSGDVDGDDNVSTKDLMIVLYGVSGRNELSEEQEIAADIDGDGKVSVSDLTRILYFVSGRNTTL